MKKLQILCTIIDNSTKKYRLMRLLYFICFLYIFMCIEGCSGDRIEAIRGEEIGIDREFDFYFSTGETTYRNLSDIDIKVIEGIILDSLSWSIPNYISLNYADVHVVKKIVEWTIEERDGKATTYKAQGFGLQIKAQLKIAENAPLEEGVIGINIPGLYKLESKIQAQATLRPGSLQKLETLKIHTSNFERIVIAIGKKVLFIVLAVIVVILALLVLFILSHLEEIFKLFIK